jgi:hypothetical protein
MDDNEAAMLIQHQHKPDEFDPGHYRTCARQAGLLDHYDRVQREETRLRQTRMWASAARRYAIWALGPPVPRSCWRRLPSSPDDPTRHGDRNPADPVGYVKAFMQLAGTREADHQGGRVGAPGLAEPRQPGSDRRMDQAVRAQALGVGDVGCSARHTSGGPGPGDRG